MVAGVPFALTVLLRAASWTYRLRLPHWARKTSGFVFVKKTEQFEVSLKQAELHKPP